ncbi:hypothetical protein BpHYR1_018365 [Brachionus plicatilis]|uniref:Uncharacterized protein n=1 Tax=Brachionus plicatilis TaxID=10195 RepID=A0A3M7PBI6_BRAPC|nr:hypothetical protein BpHYR1_018365 [Brachionus plicatilis]
MPSNYSNGIPRRKSIFEKLGNFQVLIWLHVSEGQQFLFADNLHIKIPNSYQTVPYRIRKAKSFVLNLFSRNVKYSAFYLTQKPILDSQSYLVRLNKKELDFKSSVGNCSPHAHTTGNSECQPASENLPFVSSCQQKNQ